MSSAATTTSSYVGRFAPSPTGPLHFGSLVAALAGFLDARHQSGRWLLRIEDLDPPREQAGSIELIIRSLETHGLHWDGAILYQSRRLSDYAHTLNLLHEQGLIFPCYCSRKALAAKPSPYPGTCRHATLSNKPHALRLLTEPTNSDLRVCYSFEDIFFGQVTSHEQLGDFIVRRKDGLFAYQLAVVVDDVFQGISHVIRGADLIDSTPPQRYLFACLDAPVPQFGHLPLALNAQGQKLSKQHGAKAIDDKQARDNIIAALGFLNHTIPVELQQANIEEILQWAIAHWDRRSIPTDNKTVAES